MDLQPLDPHSAAPPFEQVRVQIAARAAAGDLPPGTRLPSVRSLAAQLGLAVNTVARAYKELEADGVVVTQGRHGTSIASTVHAASDEVQDAADAFVSTARRLGLEQAEALRLVQDRWTR